MQKVAKLPLFGMDKDSSDASVKPGFYREARNLIPAQEGLSKTSLQSVPGTTVRTNSSLPAGTNTLLGAFEDSENNRVVYFIYNSNNNHGIWYFNPNTNTHTKIIQSSYLSFTSTEKITGVAAFGDNLYWTDNNGPRYIIVSKGVAGSFYDTTSANLSIQLSQYRPRPTDPPTLATQGTTRGADVLNKNSYQFATRFIYHDNSYSGISPVSKLWAADAYPADTSYWLEGTGYIYISVRVTQTVPTDVKNIIKSIQFLYRRNGEGDYYMFNEQTSTAASSYIVDFHATESASLVPDAELLSVQMIPNEATNCAIVNERVINTMNQYDYADIGSGSLTLTAATFSSYDTKRHHLPGASYTYGLVYFDRYGRTNGVVATKNIKFPQAVADLGLIVKKDLAQTQLSWGLSGTPPSWATHYAIVRKDNNSYETISQFPAQPMFYKKEGTSAALGEVLDDGKIFHGGLQSSWSGKDIYWRIPSNIPISINNKYRVRILSLHGQTREVEDPKSVVGNKIVTSNFGKTNWTSGPNYNGRVYIQLEVPKESPSDLFYEIGEVYSISGGSHQTTSGVIGGDFHLVNSGPAGGGASWFYEAMDEFNGVSYLESPPATIDYILSPSPTTARISIEDSVTQSEYVRARDTGEFAGLTPAQQFNKALLAGESKSVTTTYKTSSTLDYTKIASDNGRAFVEVFNKRISYEPNTLTISDKYVYGSKVNGLGFFSSDNLYTVPEERTPIRKLQTVGSGDLFLAIHEKTVTSLQMYTGNRVLKTSDGSEIIGEDGSIIGYDRELTGGYGTIYPESIVHHKGKVFFFDAYRGEVVRYAANGLTPIGSVYGMKNYFKTKGDQFIDTTNRSVKGGYDPNLDMYLITFRSSTSSEEDTVGFIDRQGEERWVSFYDFKPDAYCKINNKLFSFVGGVMHEHGASSTYNNFYSTQYESSLKVLANPEYSMTKIWRNIGVESNDKWTVAATNERGQATSLTEAMFKNREGAYYADWRRDGNTNSNLINRNVITNSTITGSLTPWANQGTGNSWAYNSPGAGVVLTAKDVPSKELYQDIETLPAGLYGFTLKSGGNTAGGGTIRVRVNVYKDSTLVQGAMNYVVSEILPTVNTETSNISITGEFNKVAIEATWETGTGSLRAFVVKEFDMTLDVNRTSLTHGKVMKSRIMDITLTNDNTAITKIDFVDLGYINSPGHQTT